LVFKKSLYAYSRENQKVAMVHTGMECVGAAYPLLNQMMLPDEEKQKRGIPPTEWHLFSSKLVRNPNVPKNAVAHIKPKNFSYFAEARRELMSDDKSRAKADIYVDGEEPPPAHHTRFTSSIVVLSGSVDQQWFNLCERKAHRGSSHFGSGRSCL
jgi:hypothetical protein